MRILAACSPGEVSVACVDGNRLQDYALWRPGQPDGVGDVHRARVIAHVPGMAGAFLSLPAGDGFLPDSEGGAGAVEGQLTTVRITRAAQGGKGPRLSARVTQLDGPPGLVAPGPNPVERFAASYPDAPVVVDDAALAARLRQSLGERVRIDARPIDPELAEQIDALAEAELDLPGGLRASIHPTPALVAIDLDTGSATGALGAKQAAQLAANQKAMPDLARQIRLRNLSGAILVDPAGMSIKRRPLLRPALEASLAADPLRPRLLGVTALGLLEIMRPRVHPPLHEALAPRRASPYAALRALARAAAAEPHVAFGLVAAPDLLAALDRDPGALADLARRTGRPLIRSADAGLPPSSWRIERPR